MSLAIGEWRIWFGLNHLKNGWYEYDYDHDHEKERERERENVQKLEDFFSLSA